jgi:hypothetical protein
MTNNKQQMAVEWFFHKVMTFYVPDDLEEFEMFMEIVQQAKEMEVMGKEMSYDDGYAEGYKRAYELMEWCMKNYIKTREKDI